MALCYSYLRITSNSQAKRYRKVIFASLGFCMLFSVYYTLIVIFACTPIKKYWTPALPGSCLPVPMVYYVPAAVTIIIDVMLFLLPIPLVMGLHMNPRRKWGLVAAFLLGLVTTICSIMRVIGSVNIPKKGDPQELIQWAIAEMNVGVSRSTTHAFAGILTNAAVLDHHHFTADSGSLAQGILFQNGQSRSCTQKPRQIPILAIDPSSCPRPHSRYP
ncbi:hypothetical protein ANO11243_015010 [Dothideomycetidae sp. 11243]|nr:hypothetical protein ANO11243_015010 [fungal sp. No.11243]